MRTLRLSLAGTVTLSLLLSSAMAVTAQEETVEPRSIYKSPQAEAAAMVA